LSPIRSQERNTPLPRFESGQRPSLEHRCTTSFLFPRPFAEAFTVLYNRKYRNSLASCLSQSGSPRETRVMKTSPGSTAHMFWIYARRGGGRRCTPMTHSRWIHVGNVRDTGEEREDYRGSLNKLVPRRMTGEPLTVTNRNNAGQISAHASRRRSRARCFKGHEKSVRIRCNRFVIGPTRTEGQIHVLASNFWTVYASVDDGNTLYTVRLHMSAEWSRLGRVEDLDIYQPRPSSRGASSKTL
jgi:hypothetical protein